MTFTIAAARPRELGDLRLDLLGDALRADPEVLEHRGALAGGAERVDPDRGVDPARPAERRPGLDRDLRHVRPAAPRRGTRRVCASKSSQLGIETTRAWMPCSASRSRAPSAVATSAPVATSTTSPDVVLVATGAEVSTALGAREILAGSGVRAPVVSMLSWELFEAQHAEYRDEILPAGLPKISVEAGCDVRLVALGRCLDRDRHVRRVRQGPSGARALRDQPGRRRRERPGEARRAGEGIAKRS